MLSWIDRLARNCVAAPLVLLGLGLTFLAEYLIRVGAWLVGIEDEAN